MFALAALLHPASAAAADADLDAVLASTHQRIRLLDYRVTGRLVKRDGDGHRTTYKFVVKGHWFPDGMRLLCEITGPAEARTRVLVHMGVTGHITIDVSPPGSKIASSLPFERWNDGLMGTQFSYEDLVENQFFWKKQELLPRAKYGARDCYVVKSVSGPEDRSYYSSVTSWIDHDILYPVHVVKTLGGSQQKKEFVYYGLRQTGGVWSASQVEATLQGKSGSSLFIIEGGTGKAKLVRKDFDLTQPNVAEEK